MIEIRQIHSEKAKDANIPDEPFEIWGRLVPSLKDGNWEYSTIRFPEISEMCFPKFLYDPALDDALFLGAYDGENCIGLAVLRRATFRYMYLDDLKVNRRYRRKGIGGMLVRACMDRVMDEEGQGLYTVAQDNNLSACLFYLKQGFEIGGVDNRAYRGTAQEGKADIYFYWDCPDK